MRCVVLLCAVCLCACVLCAVCCAGRYPYALLSSAPGVYTMSTAPFLGQPLDHCHPHAPLQPHCTRFSCCCRLAVSLTSTPLRRSVPPGCVLSRVSDYDGIEFSLSNLVPQNGNAPGTAPLYNSTSVYFTTPTVSAYLTEGYYVTPPNVVYQQQYYSFQP